MTPAPETENIHRPIPIEYHADDFGMFPAQSLRILRCRENGLLNGVSVMPNSAYRQTCMELLRGCPGVAVTIHMNLIEGCSVCDPQEIPLLTDADGVFRTGFGRLMLHSLLPDRTAYRNQLKKELRAQIRAVMPYLEEGAPLRLDGHAHYHMVPVVFDALMDVIREEELPVGYIRIPREYPAIYLRHWRQLWRDIHPINLVKVGTLNLLAWRNRRRYGALLDSMEQRVFLGVFLSGHMFRENVAAVLPDALRLAQRKNCQLEILAHPGGIYELEDVARLTNRADIAFLTSAARRKEAQLYMR